MRPNAYGFRAKTRNLTMQHVHEDTAFFKDKHWYSLDECLERVVGELRRKFSAVWRFLGCGEGLQWQRSARRRVSRRRKGLDG